MHLTKYLYVLNISLISNNHIIYMMKYKNIICNLNLQANKFIKVSKNDSNANTKALLNGLVSI